MCLHKQPLLFKALSPSVFKISLSSLKFSPCLKVLNYSSREFSVLSPISLLIFFFFLPDVVVRDEIWLCCVTILLLIAQQEQFTL